MKKKKKKEKEDATNAKRMQNFQENVNKKVLLEWVRITGLENKNKWRLDRLLAHFAHSILGYSESKTAAFTWPVIAGLHRGIPAIRMGDLEIIQAKVSYDFWRYFMSEGRKKLSQYNKEKGSKIAVLKELTLKNTDENNLGYYFTYFIETCVVHV
ncbi:hypothetical protein COOONC_17456 [Cooperia oncophora]